MKLDVISLWMREWMGVDFTYKATDLIKGIFEDY